MASKGVCEMASERTIALVIYPGLTPLDLVGPLQVLKTLERYAPLYRVSVVAERIEPLLADNGLKFVPEKTFAEVPHPFAILVPGGGEPTLKATANEHIRAYVRNAAETAEVVASVCTGALILGSVGLIKGQPATTHWAFAGVLNALGSRYQRKRWVEQGKFICSAGVSAGIDMALELVARLTDEETSRKVQLDLQYDPQPPFGRIDWSKLSLMEHLIRFVMTLRAPLIAAKAHRLSLQGK